MIAVSRRLLFKQIMFLKLISSALVLLTSNLFTRMAFWKLIEFISQKLGLPIVNSPAYPDRNLPTSELIIYESGVWNYGKRVAAIERTSLHTYLVPHVSSSDTRELVSIWSRNFLSFIVWTNRSALNSPDAIDIIINDQVHHLLVREADRGKIVAPAYFVINHSLRQGLRSLPSGSSLEVRLYNSGMTFIEIIGKRGTVYNTVPAETVVISSATVSLFSKIY